MKNRRKDQEAEVGRCRLTLSNPHRKRLEKALETEMLCTVLNVAFKFNLRHYTEGKLGEMSMEEETKLRKKVIKGNWNIAKDKASQQVRPHRTSVLNLTSCHCERRFR